MAETLVVQSKIKELVKKLNMRTSSDFTDALSRQVEELVKKAARRAKENGRQTVRAHDL